MAELTSADSSTQLKSGLSPLVKVIALCFTLVYFTGTIIWVWPRCPQRDELARRISPVWTFMGWRQNWGVFAPKLRQVNYHTTATVTFRDGSTLLYELPRMEKMNLVEKYLKEKWRKWGNDNMSWPHCRAYWPDVARWIARKFATSSNPPVQVTLNLHRVQIPPPDKFVLRSELPEHTDCKSTFIYRVKQRDIQ